LAQWRSEGALQFQAKIRMVGSLPILSRSCHSDRRSKGETA
jgi:hypothetical protein